MKLFLLCAALCVSASSAGLTKLLTFDGAKATSSFKVDVTNDPVMGGASTSSFNVQDKLGVFNGTCAIVSFLKAPGFANIIARPASRFSGGFADADSEAERLLRRPRSLRYDDRALENSSSLPE